MEPFKVGHASDTDWQTACQSCLAQIGDVPHTFNLGFLYVTDTWVAQLPDILEQFRAATGIECWVGTVGMGICTTGQEYFDQPAIAVMVAAFPDDSFRVFRSINTGLDEFVRTNRKWYAKADSHFGIVHADPRNANIPSFIVELADEIIGGFLVGGLTSSRGAHAQIAQTVTEGGISGVLFAGDVSVITALTQGCSPIGPTHIITECEENVAIALDGRPALDVFKEDVGGAITHEPRRSVGHVFAALPIKGSDTGDYLVRHVIGVDPETKVLAVSEALEVGSSIMFCRRDVESAQKDMLRMLQNIKDRAAGTPRGGVYYSCVGRGPNLFGQNSAELKIIQSQLGDFPLVGFFCNGEVSHNRLYGYTGVLTLFL
ncbi:MAG: FIST N-terminal domain-containing protein [Acidiferrobacterales bacterium]